MSKRSRSRLFIILLILAALVLGFVVYYRQAVRLEPPRVDENLSKGLSRKVVSPGVFTCKGNWLRKNRFGLYEMYLEGKPYEMGLANGRLTKELLGYQERVFVDRLRELVPSPRYLSFLRYFVAWFDRDLDKYVPEEYQQEICGVSRAALPGYDFIASNYQRILNYHAAHDIGHAMQNMNLVGCTAFARWNAGSGDSSLIIGRNFDFYMGDDFARNKIVAFLHPAHGYRLMMVTWGGMTGVVSGMNEKGLTVTLNSARSSIPGKAKMPVSLLARLILQYASTIDEAVRIADEHETFVSESFLVGAAVDNRAVVIEKSPEKTDVYTPSGSRLVLTNHFQGEAFMTDRRNIESMAESASAYRYKRVEELMDRYPSAGPVEAAAILRDRRGLRDADIGLGNEKAVNQLIAHHSVIFMPGRLLAWVSTAPYQEGPYVCYDLKKIFSEKPDITREIDDQSLEIPADTFLLSKQWFDYQAYVKQTESIRKKLDKGETGFLGSPDIQAYLSLNPGFYYPHLLIGRYYEKQALFSKAAIELELSLQKEIPRKVDRDAVLKLRQKVAKKLPD